MGTLAQPLKERAAMAEATVGRRPAACLAPAVLMVEDSMMRRKSDVWGRRQLDETFWKEERMRRGGGVGENKNDEVRRQTE